MKLNKQLRKLHYWISPFIFLPVLVIFSTGVLLQLKKQSDWIQPPIQQGVNSTPSVQFEMDNLGRDINEIPVLKHITS